MDTSQLMFPKGDPLILIRRAKDRADAAEWKRVCKKVDRRDKRRCQVTGVQLDSESPDKWTALERHHLEFRSQNRERRHDWTNVWTVSRGVHKLIHVGLLHVLTKRGEKAEDVREIYAVAWNYDRVQRGKEPCSVLRGWRKRAA